MVQVVWTKKARRCLGEIHKYIADENPEAAQRVIRTLLSKAQLLSSFPLLGAAYPLEDAQDLRVLFHGHHRIAYVIRGNEIHVLGVFHERMDIARHLAKKKQ